MSRLEIKKLYTLPNGIHLPCGLNFREKLWWRFMPGVVINVKWPNGWVVLHEAPDGSKVSAESADPNDHYRPELEKEIGKQGIHWNWGVANNGVAENRLTIKVLRKFKAEAAYFALKWS
jgi:hypothetical protein